MSKVFQLYDWSVWKINDKNLVVGRNYMGDFQVFEVTKYFYKSMEAFVSTGAKIILIGYPQRSEETLEPILAFAEKNIPNLEPVSVMDVTASYVSRGHDES